MSQIPEQALWAAINAFLRCDATTPTEDKIRLALTAAWPLLRGEDMATPSRPTRTGERAMTPEERAHNLFWKEKAPPPYGVSAPRSPTQQEVAQAIREAEAEMQERCARVAYAHKGAAAKRPRERGFNMKGRPYAEIYAEERGEDIAAEIIARSIRSLPTSGGEG